MISLKESILGNLKDIDLNKDLRSEISKQYKVITYTQDDVNPRSNCLSLDANYEKCHTVIIKDVNLSIWTFDADTFRNVKQIKFENCSGVLFLRILKMRGLEHIDFSDCKDKLTIMGGSFINNCPKLKMKASDWMTEFTPDKHGNKWIHIGKSPFLNDKCFPEEYSKYVTDK